jgi:hypothetical protein
VAKTDTAIVAFNRGRVSKLALAREDLKRVLLSAEQQTNWMPRVLGSMMLRVGMEHLGASANHAPAKHIDFIYANDDTALVEVTEDNIRIWIDDELLTRPSVSATVTNGTFDTDLSGWTDADESGGVSSWHPSGYMQLVGNGSAAARMRQEVVVTELETEHALRVVVRRGPATIKVGSSAGGDDYIEEATLQTGEHSLSFTPTGNFHIELSSRRIPAALVEEITVEAAGPVELPSPWLEEELGLLRHVQSADVVFVACDGVKQHRIERRGDRPNARGWSIVDYVTEDGPFRPQNLGPVTITPSGLTGDVTLAASAPLFKAGHVGALWQIASTGQVVEVSITAQNTFSDPIRVTGVGGARIFGFTVAGTFSASWTIQQSVGEPGNWQDTTTQTAPVSTSYDDNLDNQIVYYRIGVKTGNFTSGQVDCQLSYSFGSVAGVARITGFTNAQSVTAAVVIPLGGTTATDEWAEGVWSSVRGFPSAVSIHEGRMIWAGKDKVWGSVSDAFDSFDPETEGDSGPLARSIGSGPVDSISWLLSLARLLMGAQGAEFSVRSSNFDEPLTPTNFAVKRTSTLGSAKVPGVLVDSRAIFVQRNGHRVYELSYAVESNEYVPTDLSQLIPEIGRPHIVRMAVQRQPDTRVHCVRSDGTAAVLIFDPTENVICWIDVETDGEIEDVVILPGDEEDYVYYHIKRTIDGSDVRYLEKWALESDCQGGDLNKQADSFVVYDGTPTLDVPNLDHLEGEEVVVWADGQDVGTASDGSLIYTVTGGKITLAVAASKVVVGLYYRARYKSTKLAYGAQNGSSLTKNKRINSIAPVLANTHAKGLMFGSAFDSTETMDPMPDIEEGALVDEGYIWEHYDQGSTEFPGDWDDDSRLCLQAAAPRPCTVLGCVISMDTKG